MIHDLARSRVRDEPVQDGYLSPGVRLTGFDVFKRVCVTCWEPSDTLVAPT